MLVANRTPLAAVAIAGQDVDRARCATVIAKGTFDLKLAGLTLSPSQEALVGADEHYDDDFAKKSCRHESDFVQWKPGADLIVRGFAHAPGGEPQATWRCAVEAQGRRKEILVHGDRNWICREGIAPRISETVPTTRVELRYENAFGGQDLSEAGQETFEARNPIGKGFVSHFSEEVLNGVALPNLEDPAQPITRSSDRPMPQGTGFWGRAWQPRLKKAGTYDDAWLKTRHPFLPDDFEWAYQNAAHPDLIFPRYFEAGEPIALTNLTESGALTLELPSLRPLATVRHLTARLPLPMNLDTLVLDVEERRAQLIWRGFFRAERPLSEYETVELMMAG